MRKTPKQITISYSGEDACKSGEMGMIVSVLKEKCGSFPTNMNSSYNFVSEKGNLTYNFNNNADFPDSSRMENILQKFNLILDMEIKKIEVNDGRETYTVKNKYSGTNLK